MVKCQNSLSLNYDISAVYAPKDIIWEIFFSTFTLIRYLRSVVSPLNINYLVYASPFLLLSHIWAQSHCFFPAVITIFEENLLLHFMYCHVWNLHTRREELKTKFQLNIFRPYPIQRVGTYLGLKIPHNALLKWRELKQVVDNIFYLELLQVTASNLFSTAECFLFATAILFIF